MHDYSRDIMLANAQQDMEVNLAKMQLNKKIALTKSNEDKAGKLKKENEELGYMFVPTQVCIIGNLLNLFVITINFSNQLTWYKESLLQKLVLNLTKHQ